MHTLTENVKKREVQYTLDTLENKKDCNHNLYRNKKICSTKKPTVQSIDKSQCKKYERKQKCQAQKET